MATLKHYFYQREHHFLLENGVTKFGTPAGVWATYTPPTGTQPGVVMMLYATKESRHYVPHVLGAIALHSIRTYGELPEGSHNLSCHSIGIQRRLASLLGQLPASAVVNQENWFNSIEYNKFFSGVVEHVKYDDITYDIDAGKEFVLNVINELEPA